MAQKIIESRLIPFNLQSGDGSPSHISPAGTMYFDRIFGLTYQNLNGISTWSLLGGGGGSTFTGGTVTGPTIFLNGLTTTTISTGTISATTYFGLPKDIFVTGGTYGAGTATFTNNTGGTFNVVGFSTSGGEFTGGTVSGATIFTGGLSANTFSATTYFNLPKDIFVTGGTYSAGTTVFKNNSGGTFSVSGFSTGDGITGDYLPLSGGTVTGDTVFTAGLTATTISATTYYNLPLDVFVTGGTYTNGTTIFTNNTGGTFNVSGFPIGGGGGQLFYLNISQSKGTNRYLSTTASTSAEQSTGVTISAGATGTIASFQSDQLGVTLIPGGIWSFYLHSYKQNNNASFNIFVELYKITSGGTSTLLFTSDPAPVTTNSPNPSMQLTDAYFSGSPVTITDSIVAVVRATNTGNQSHTITLVSEGTQHYSYVVSTLATQQGLTCATLSGCSVIQTIQSDINNKLDKSGGTITGNLIINGTLSATTYLGLSLDELDDVLVTGATDGQVLTYSAATGLWVPTTVSGGTGTVPSGATVGSFGVTIDGLGGVISIGQQGYVSIPYNATINGWTLLADQVGSCVIDVWKDTFGTFPPTSGDTIAGSERPTLTSQSANRNLNLTGWTTNISTGDIIGFNVLSATGITRANLIINVTKS